MKNMDANIKDFLEKISQLNTIIYCIDDEELLSLLLGEIKKIKSSKVIIIHCLSGYENCDNTIYFERNKLKEIIDFYNLYDFSNNVITITGSSQYGSLLNYEKEGILNKKEIAEVLLYKLNLGN